MDRRKEQKQNLIWLLLGLALFSLSACQGTNKDKQQAQAAGNDQLSHLVFLALKENTAVDSVRSKLLMLSQIPEVNAVKVVERSDIGDPRALDYDLLLIVEFESLEDLKIYDKDELHQQVRAELRPYLRLPPATFDYQPRE